MRRAAESGERRTADGSDELAAARRTPHAGRPLARLALPALRWCYRKMPTTRALAAPLLIALGLTTALGCSGGSRSKSAAADQLSACAGGLSDDAVTDAITITTDFEASCHELVVCGGLANGLSTSVVQLFIDAAIGAAGGGGLMFDGKGTYRSPPGSVAGTNMDVTLHLPKDTSFGKTGDVITSDLLTVESYFVGAKLKTEGGISTSGITAKLKVTYESLGPAFELLGLSAPPGPAEVTLEAQPVSRALSAIKLRAKTHVDDAKGASAFVYDLTSPETTLGDLVDGGALRFQLDGVNGARSDLGQKLESTKWEIVYAGGKVGKLDGTIGIGVLGGPLPHRATFVYPKSNKPKITYACP